MALFNDNIIEQESKQDDLLSELLMTLNIQR